MTIRAEARVLLNGRSRVRLGATQRGAASLRFAL